MWFVCNNYQVLFVIVLSTTYAIATCDPISNTNFNSHIRHYSAIADINNTTNVKTLQKEDIGKYATFTPASNPIKFKEIPDSALSSSSNGRGLLYHEQPGYAINDYDEGPHYSHGHDYQLYDPHTDHHGPNLDEHPSHLHSDHNGFHDPHSHPDYLPSKGHHYSGHIKHHPQHHGYDLPGFYKHYNHHSALAAKTVLWPIAGIALLGAAAALVSNPILLQLGVVSGKRRRRDTEEVTGPDLPSEMFKKYEDKIKELTDESKNVHLKENLRKKSKQNRVLKIASLTETVKRKEIKTDNLKHVSSNLGVRKTSSSVKRNIGQATTPSLSYNSYNDDDRFIPIPIKLRTPIVTE